MEHIMIGALLVAAALNYCLQAVYFTHMLQLNSYRPERYKKWCTDNDRKLVSWQRLLPFLCVLTLWLYDRVPVEVLYGVSAGVLLLTALLNIPRKAKKPLVITARVKRLFITQGVLLLAVLALVWWLLPQRGLGVVGLFSMIIWLWTGLANYINLPLEKKIAAGYVKDARRRLEERNDLTVIGVTGSYGKTSVKTFLAALLGARYNVLMTPGSYNTTMGVVRTIREMLRPSHQVFIAEMGAKNPGDIAEICDLVHPAYGIITSIGEQHLETFGSLDNIIKTKFELADAVPAEGTVFLNWDNEYIRSREVAVPVVTYATEQEADYRATDITVDSHGCQFTLVAPDGETCRYTTRLLGVHNIQNLAGCMAVAHRLGVSLKEMIYPVRMLKPVEHRLQLLPNGYIDDAYNSNPAGFRSALDTLSGFAAQRVLVTPGMVELGDRQEALNRELGTYAATRCDYAVLVGLRQAPPLREGLLEGGFPEDRIFVAATLQEGLAYVNQLPANGQRIVLLENDLPDNF
ncbi:MAG: UDP-N-acetylmuramoyl-tripeptide--D-alanyl-D-alanine ligase [Ruminococcaceae bacterium]|nr:UDP-N-acetylmuramoyl-tripeptide--D-alanyl-D-alanine ligase [Oscillospiraceae bacterium]